MIRALQGEDSPSNNDHESAALASLLSSFRPVLELVFPGCDVEDEDEEDAMDVATILQFFQSRGATGLDHLGVFDTHHLIWDEFLSKSFDERSTVQRLGIICEYIAVFGAKSLLKFLEELSQKPIWACVHCHRFSQFDDHNGLRDLHIGRCAKMDHRSYLAFSETRQRADATLEELSRVTLISTSLSDHAKVSMHGTRIALRNLFREQSFWGFMKDPSARQREMDEKALGLLERFPSLAWERFEHGSGTGMHSYPLYYFLWAGCEMKVLKQVLGYNSQVLSSGKQGFEDLLMAASLISDGISITIFERMLELMPELTTERKHRVNFLERLYYLGFNSEVLDFVRSLVENNQSEFTLHRRSPRMISGGRRWEMDVSRADVLVRMMPCLQHVECDISEWTLDGWSHFLDSIPERLHPKLETLRISIPVHIVLSEFKAREALKKFFGRMDFSLKEVALIGDRENQRPFDVFTSCLKEISEGILSNTSSSCLEQLKLKNFAFSGDGSEHLFDNDIYGALDVQFDCLRYSCPWDSKEINTDGVRVLNLGLHGFSLITFVGWRTMWKKISKLSRVEKIMYSPGHSDYLSGWLTLPLNSIAKLPRLTTLCLMAHTHDITVDVTEPIAELLRHGTLEFLQIEGSHEDHEGNIGCLAYRVDAKELCHLLKNNRSLQFLFLRGVELRGSEISRAFLEVLQEYNNTTIEFMDICDDAHFFTVIPKDSWRRDLHHGFTYESYPHAWQIYYLTCFNRFGRGKVQNKSTMAAEFVQLLTEVYSQIDVGAEEETFHRQIHDLAIQNAKEDSVAHLDRIYGLLHRSPSLWCNAVKRTIESMSIRYGLLRESPGLWCSCVSQSAFDHTTKRRRLV